MYKTNLKYNNFNLKMTFIRTFNKIIWKIIKIMYTITLIKYKIIIMIIILYLMNKIK